MRHVLEEPVQARYGGKDGLWRVACSCGYQARSYSTAERALQVARTHQSAKLAFEEKKGVS